MRGTVRILAVFLLFGSGIWTPARSDSKKVGDSEEAMSVKSALTISRAQTDRSPRPRQPKGRDPQQEDKGQRPKTPRPKEPESRPGQEPPAWDHPIIHPIPDPPRWPPPRIVVEYMPMMGSYDRTDERLLATALSVGMAAANAWLLMSERQSELVSIGGIVVGGGTIIAAVIDGGNRTLPMLATGMASLALGWMALERGNQISVTASRSF